jgi:hypothetical protein
MKNYSRCSSNSLHKTRKCCFEILGEEYTVILTTEKDGLHKLVMVLKEVNFVTSKLSQKHNVCTLKHS